MSAAPSSIVIKGRIDPVTRAAIEAALLAAPEPVEITAYAGPDRGTWLISDVIGWVSADQQVYPSVIIGDSRAVRPALWARDLVVWAASELLGRSPSSIGAALGGRDSSTISIALSRAKIRRRDDAEFAAAALQLTALLTGAVS
ncbi:MAG: hypothetical protein ABIS51_18415 [Sphingomonas sp.]